MTWGLVYWPIGLVILGLLFLPAEMIALFTDPQNTLSWYCWHELDVTRALTFDAHGVAWWVSLISWLLFVVVITLHIWYRSV